MSAEQEKVRGLINAAHEIAGAVDHRRPVLR